MDSYGLNDWRLEFRHMTATLGKCFQGRKLIKLSTYFIAVKPASRILNTILHEIAHALTPGHGHDLAWKQKAMELGAIPRARLSDELFNSEKEKNHEKV